MCRVASVSCHSSRISSGQLLFMTATIPRLSLSDNEVSTVRVSGWVINESSILMALPQKSAQPTSDISPPIHRWDQRDQERQSVKRTAESGRACQSRIYQSSVSRTGAARDCLPSTEVLGYFHSSASRTEQDRTFWAKRLRVLLCGLCDTA